MPNSRPLLGVFDMRYLDIVGAVTPNPILRASPDWCNISWGKRAAAFELDAACSGFQTRVYPHEPLDADDAAPEVYCSIHKNA